MVDPDIDPALVGGEVIDPVRDRLAELLVLESCTRTRSGSPLGRHSRPAFLKSPTSSFFLVSTQITGCPVDRALGDRVDVLKLRVAVGVLRPSRVLTLACRLYPSPRSSFATVVKCAW